MNCNNDIFKGFLRASFSRTAINGLFDKWDFNLINGTPVYKEKIERKTASCFSGLSN